MTDATTEERLRRTLTAAADATDVGLTHVETLPLIVASPSGDPASTGHARWLAAAAVAVLVVGAGAFAIDGRRDDPDPSERVQVGASGTTSTTPGTTNPTDDLTSLIVPRPVGEQWLPVLTSSLLPDPKAAIPLTRIDVSTGFIRLEPTQDALVAYGTIDLPAPYNTVATVTVSNQPEPAAYAPFATGATGTAITTVRGTVRSADGLSFVWGNLAYPDELTLQTIAVGGAETFTIRVDLVQGTYPLTAVVESFRVAGWQDGSLLPTWPVIDDQATVPAPGSRDIWPTDPPVDYCEGWRAFYRIQLEAPGPQTVQTNGFVRYTTQLETIAPEDLPASYRTLREGWLDPGKTNVDDDADGTGAAQRHIFEVSTRLCPG